MEDKKENGKKDSTNGAVGQSTVPQLEDGEISAEEEVLRGNSENDESKELEATPGEKRQATIADFFGTARQKKGIASSTAALPRIKNESERRRTTCL